MERLKQIDLWHEGLEVSHLASGRLSTLTARWQGEMSPWSDPADLNSISCWSRYRLIVASRTTPFFGKRTADDSYCGRNRSLTAFVRFLLNAECMKSGSHSGGAGAEVLPEAFPFAEEEFQHVGGDGDAE